MTPFSPWPGPPEPRYTTGVLAKYARLAQGAEKGAITNDPEGNALIKRTYRDGWTLDG